MFKPEVVVKIARVMFLDDKGRAGRCCGSILWDRLWRFGAISLRPIRLQSVARDRRRAKFAHRVPPITYAFEDFVMREMAPMR